MSADYAGDSSNALTTSVLNSVSQLGSAEILANQSTQLSTPTLQAPLRSAVIPQTSSSMGSIFIVLILVLVGLFAFKKL